MKKQFLTFVLLFSTLLSCSEDKEIGADGCSPDVICTEIYKSIAIELKYPDGSPYSLDEYYTIKKSTGERIDLDRGDLTLQQKYGKYPVLDDGHLDQTTRGGQDFVFTGKKNDKIVVEQTFTIGHDCCHVVLRKGETEVVIDK